MQTKGSFKILLLLAAFSSIAFFANGLTWPSNSRTYSAFECNSGSYDYSWNYPWHGRPNCNGDYFAGYLGGGESMWTSIYSVPSHSRIRISFKLALLDSWDEETFYVLVDGITRYSIRTQWGRHPSNVCGAGWWRDTFTDAYMDFDHTGGAMTVQFASNLDQWYGDESWGICNLQITATGCAGGQLEYGGNCYSTCPWGTFPNGAVCSNCDGFWCISGSSSQTIFSCGNPQYDSRFVYSAGWRVEYCAGKYFFGRYGSGTHWYTESSRLYFWNEHQGVKITFWWGHFDSWDFEPFVAAADNREIFREYPILDRGSRTNMCFAGWNDQIDFISTGFNHTGQSLKLGFSAALNQDFYDESWGICDVTITPYSVPVDRYGNPINGVYPNAANYATYQLYFGCDNPVRDAGWNYFAGYSRQYCNGQWYLGGYGGTEYIQKEFHQLPYHQSIHVKFQLASIDSWDYEYFYVNIDDRRLVTRQYYVWGGGRAALSGCGNGGWWDGVEVIDAEANHNAGYLKLFMTSTLDQYWTDEAWGICNLQIWWNYCPVGQFRQGDSCQGSCSWGFVEDIDTRTCVSCSQAGKTCVNSGTVLYPSSNPTALPGWSYNQGFRTTQCGGYNFLGKYGAGGEAQGPIKLQEAHSYIRMEFRFAPIDSWDFEHFYISADGVVVFDKYWWVLADGKTNICQSGWGEIIESFTIGFAHSSPDLTLRFWSSLNQDPNDEAWGISDLKFTLTNCQLDKYGRCLSDVITASVLTAFSCSSADKENNWDYTPYYTKIQCGSNIYQGRFANGAQLSTNYFNLPAHQALTFQFNLAFIDNWAGHTFYVKVDNNVVYQQAWTSNVGSNVCGAGYPDSFQAVVFTVGHQSSSMTIQMYSNNNQDYTVSGWGICDFKILINSCPSNQYLHGASCLSICPWGFYALETDRICKQCADGTPCVSKASTFYSSANPQPISGWNYNPSFNTYRCAGEGNRVYLRYGPYQTVSGRLYMGAPHTAVLLSFRMMSIDSWDWETFNVRADGSVVFSESFWHSQDGRVNMCGQGWRDDVENYVVAFNHTSQTLNLQFDSTLNQDYEDESWGIADLSVTLVDCGSGVGIDSFGRCLNAQSSTRVYTAFGCNSMAKDNYWSYNQGYTTYGCNSETFVGRYGAGGSISTYFRGAPAHQSIIVSFKILATDQWNSQQFIVKADGANVYSQTLTWSDNTRKPLCGNSGGNANDLVDTITVAFNHNVAQLSLSFTSTLAGDFQSQGWGVCDVKVSFNVCPTGKFNTGGVCVDVCPWGQYPDEVSKNCLACTNAICANIDATTAIILMPCSNPTKMSQFAYVSKYQTVGASGKTFVGAYTQGDYISGPIYFTNPHSGVLVSFELYLAGAWNDVFTVQADGKTVFAETVTASKTIILGFNHTEPVSTLKFSASITTTAKSWGICAITITPMDVPVNRYGQGLPKVDTNGAVQLTKSMYNTIQQIACLCSSGAGLPSTFLNDGYLGMVKSSTGPKFDICDIAKASYCFITCGDCQCNGKRVKAPSAQALEAVVLKTSMAKQVSCPGGCKDAFGAGKTLTGETFAADCANFNVNNIKYKVTQTSDKTLTQTIIVEKRFDADDNQPKPTKPPRSTATIDFGPSPPVATCGSQVFKTTAVTSDLINLLGDAKVSASNNITLTSGLKNQRSAIWYKNPVDAAKGFKVEFMLNLLNPTCTKISYTETKNYKITDCVVTTDTFDNTITKKDCKDTPVSDIITYQRDSDNCGSEGVAFVIQPNNPSQIGTGGAGLGYEGIPNALAIEFDASYDYVKNDPDLTKARHISIILKKGAADANEDNAIAWNDKPLDFKAWDMNKPIQASQVVNPLVRIEYMGSQIRVYLNNILQLSYSHKLDLAKELGQSTPKFYIGFTGSTSDLVQTSSIFAWNLGEVQAYADTSVAEIYYPSGATQDQINNFMGAGIPFDVYVTVKDKCSNSYAYDDLSQISIADVNGIEVISNKTCIINTKEVNTNKAVAAHFRLSVTCTVAKLNYFNIQFQGRAIRDQPLMWRTIAGPVSKGAVLFDVDGVKAIGAGNTDKSFVFMLSITDAYGNVVPATTLQVISAIKINWPNPSDSKQTHTAVFSTDTNLFYIFVDADKTGAYTISSPWFANSRTYQFVISGGLASAITSSVELVDAGFNPLTKFTGLQAGQNTIRVLMHVRDSKWNELPIKTSDDIAAQLYWTFDEIGRSIITTPVPIQHQLLTSHPGFKIDAKRQQAYFEVTPTTIGVNSFVTYIFGGKAACAACTLNFVPGPMVFENTRLWAWHPNFNVYYDDLQPSSTLFNHLPLSFLIVLRDQYNNVIDENPFNFKVTLSGYNMQVMDLTACNQTYRFGKKYTACNSNLSYQWLHLVKKIGYDVTIAYPNDLTKALKRKVDIVTSVDDLDAGNGPFVPELTQWWPSVNVPHLWAGHDNYYFIVSLKNSEGLRFNEWLDKSRISLRVFDTDGTELTKDSRVTIWSDIYWRWGYHVIGTNIQKSGKMTYQLTIDGKSYSAIKSHTQTIKPWIADNGFIQADTLETAAGRVFKEGNVEFTQSFTMFVFDAYKNPSDFAGNRINLEIKGENGLNWSPTITKDTTVDGKYAVTWNTPYAMKYNINSHYFRRNASGKTYSIYMRPGFPSRVTSYAQLIFDPSKGTTLLATDVVNFALKPRDRFGNEIPAQNFVGKTDNFTLTYTDPKSQKAVLMTNSTQGATFAGKLKGVDNSHLVWTETLNSAGTTVFRPLLKGESVVCSVCSVLVDPNAGYFPNAEIAMIVNGNPQTVKETLPTLTNYDNYPIFTLQMADKVYNLRTIDAGWSNFKATLENTGNSTRYSYSLTPSIWANGMKFAFLALDPQVDNYKKSAFNKEWLLKFSADKNGQTYDRTFKNVTLYGQGPVLDSEYDNADIDATKCVVTINSRTLEAGRTTTAILQIRTKNNKIRKDIYTNVASKIKVSLTPAQTSVRTSVVSTGAYGLYLITIYGEIAQNYTINVNVADDNDKMSPITQKPILPIIPTTYEYSVLMSDQNDQGGNPVPLTVDNTYSFVLTPYDRFGNIIYAISPIIPGVTIKTKVNNQVLNYKIGSVLQANGLYNYTIYPETAGTVLLTGNKLKNKDLIAVKSLELTLKPGKFNPGQSIGNLIPEEINAGQTYLCRLNPRDQYGNAIVIEDDTQEAPDVAAKKLKLVHTYPNGTNVNITLISSEIYTWKFDPNVTVIRSGDHKFTLTYDDKPVTLSKSTLKVWPLPADFGTSLLYQYDPSKNVETPYNGSRFAFDASQLPTVSLILNDQYNNTIKDFPSTWKLTAYIRDKKEQIEMIYMCPAGNKFTVCPSNKTLWYSLAPAAEYSLFFNLGDTGKKVWDFKLFGFNSSNSDISNYPLSVQNSILSPTSAQTLTAGQSINFFIELRATDNGRKALTFANPNQNITFSIPGLVEGNDFKVSSTEGDKAGRYNTILTIFKTTPALTNFNAQLVLANTYYDTAIPKVTVVPASYNSTVALFANLTAYPANVTTLQNSTTDYKYVFYLKSVDFYGNKVPATVSDIAVSIYDPVSKQIIPSKTLLTAGVAKVTFQPTSVGTYIIKTKGMNYTFTIAPGTPDAKYTNSTLDSNTSLAAGANFTFTVTTFDRYGNPTNVSSDLITLFKVYFKRDADIFYQYASYVPDSINKNSLKFTANITEQGHYVVYATLSGLNIRCLTCSMAVIPGAIYPLNSILSFFDVKGQQFVVWKRDRVAQEENIRSTPLYQLEVADVYGNVYSDLPESYKSQVSFKLTPPVNETSALPAPGYVDYTSTLADGNLFVNVSLDSNATYFGASQAKGSYILTATIGGVAIPYSVFIVGAGAEDLDASYGAFDINQTYVNRKSIVTSVTVHELIMIELRTVDGKRKKDLFTPEITLGFAFDGAKPKYTVTEGDKPGRYLISLQSNRSYPAWSNQSISYSINGTITNTTTSWVVAPGPTRSIVNLTTFDISGSTDRDFVIQLNPLDEFNNIAIAQPEDIYCVFLTPDGSAIQYTSKTSEFGSIIYNIQAKVTGQYSFISWMFTDGLNNKFFNISAGMIDGGRSNATFEVSSSVAGDVVKLYLFPKDSYGNLVPTTDRSVKSAYAITYSLNESPEEISFPLFFNDAGAVNPDFVGAVFANITITRSGKYRFFIQSKEAVVPCTNSCTLDVSFNKPALVNTKFLVFSGNNQFQEATTAFMQAGSENVNVDVKIYDKYNNPVRAYTDQQKFLAVWTGHNMTHIVLNTTINNGDLMLSVPTQHRKNASWLVPAEDYQIQVFYQEYDLQADNFLNISNYTLKMIVQGDASDAGNGPMIPQHAKIDVTSSKISNRSAFINMTAGEETSFVLTLRTINDERYNEDFDPKTIAVTARNQSNWNFKWFTGGSKNIFTIYASTNVSSELETLTVFVDGVEVGQPINVNVNPSVPDITKTVLHRPTIVENHKFFYITFELFDRFGNQFYMPYTLQNFTASVNSGNVQIVNKNPQKLENNSLTIQLVPSYPPINFSVQVSYSVDGEQTVAVFGEPLNFTVRPVLDPYRLEVSSDIFTTGITSDDDIEYDVYLHDTEGYCYEPRVNFNTTISGPYADNNPTSDALVGGALTVNSLTSPVPVAQSSDDVSSCQMIYHASFPAGTAKTAGYYKIQVLMNDESNNTLVVYNQKVLRVVAGPMSAPKSTIFVPGRENLGSQPWTIQVGTPFTFFLQAYDENANIITDARNDVVDASFANTFYNRTVNYFANGTWAFTFVVNTTGQLYTSAILNFTVNNQSINVAQVISTDFPTAFIFTPGDCSYVVPVVSPNFENTTVMVGDRSSYLITCQDKFGNRVEKGGATFRVGIQGNNLQTVGSDILPTSVSDNQDGTYTVSFEPSWAGVYAAAFYILESANSGEFNYGAILNFTAIWDKCSIESPYLCPNEDKCISAYSECTDLIPVNCTDPMRPILCTVMGMKDQCVEAESVCDAPEGYSSCDTYGDNKFVPSAKAEEYCPAVSYSQWATCDNGYGDSVCLDTTCRYSFGDCPSPALCPVGFSRCLDNTCVPKDTPCTTDFAACDPQSVRCPTMECKSSIDECPSRVTCTPGQYVCLSDNSCVQSASQCRPPSKSGPPVQITCFGATPTLCSSGICVDTLSNCPTAETSSRRLLDTSNATQIQDGGCPAPTKRCPGGECVLSEILCPKILNCPPTTVRCSDNTCAASAALCFNAACNSENPVQCWNGMCVADDSSCPTRSSCPAAKPVKCHDGTCSATLSDCNQYISCPVYLPVRCDSGDCRQHKSDCPTIPTCPEALPVLCQDGSCRKSVQHCENPANVVVPQGKVRCPDGSFAFSSSICPTGVTCARGFLKCWDGACVSKLSQCAKSIDQYNGALRCPDGSVRSKIEDCPTRRICPSTSPVLCDDGNCRASSSQCVSNTCPAGLRICPDGTCAQSSCGTPITCSPQAPYKCYDNTCRSDPRDCPQVTTCPGSSPILCPDGTCVQDRMFCKALQACDSASPVRCPNMACVTTAEACTELNVCPQGSIACEDGTCAPEITKCKPAMCPPHLSFKCPDGFCVADLKSCDVSANACPADKSTKCSDGLCVSNSAQCKTTDLSCPSGATLCPDGSCAPAEQCPLANGCPANTPLRCASGECIDSTTRNCTITKCPSDAPIKCLNGFCAKSNLFCIASFSNEDAKSCAGQLNGNFVPCADGRCVSSADLCRPVLPCPMGMSVRCDDGSCRAVKSQCPKSNSCPPGRSYRCNNGVCAKDSTYCPQPNGCPTFASTKCPLTGDCAANSTVCEKIYATIVLPNNCTAKSPYLCSSGECAANKASCPKIQDCPDGEFLCPDKVCRPFWKYDAIFPESADNNCMGAKNFCPSTSFVCPDLSCKALWSDCKAKNKCPIDTPFKCGDGSCKAEPTGPNGCSPTITCSDRNPFLCADGTCVGDPSLCKVLPPCPADSPLRCADRSCTSNLTTCKTQSICPITTPVLCRTGGCVSTVIECPTADDKICPDATPFTCASGICVNHALKCFMGTAAKETTAAASRRLLETLSITTSANYDCPTSKARCADGTCRGNSQDCPIAGGCFDPAKPYKCSSGRCVLSEKECANDFVQTCATGTSRCEDGLCRISCFAYNGCPLSRPLQCPDGYCGVNAGECAGESACDNDKPFRCADSTCSDSFFKCQRAIRTFKPFDIEVSVSPFSSQRIDFIHSNESFISYATVTIPSGAFSSDSTSSSDAAQYVGFTIRSIPDSVIANYSSTLLLGSEIKARKYFPLVQSQLAAHQAVRSAAVNFSVATSSANGTYKYALLLTITYDPTSTSVDVSDYCLGLAVNSTWKCTSRNYSSYNNETNTISFLIPQNGVWAILYNPLPAPQAVLQDDCTSWACKNKFATLAISIGSTIIFCIIAFYLHRVYRYQVKYRETKVTLANYKQKITELQSTKTNVYGQTLRDKVEGISFVANPLYEKYLQETIQNQESRFNELESALEKKKAQDKEVENSHKKLSSENRVLTQELHKMKNQVAAQNLKKNDKVKISKASKVSEFM